MGKLITIVGNTGAGKTTLTRQLCKTVPFISALEQHVERPFQALFAQDLHRFALANQIDYLIYRAEQELQIRQGNSIGIQDGGLDQDYFIFTRHFYQKGFLSDSEYQVCQRFYALTRQSLPPPDLIIWLTAPLEVITHRFLTRGRMLEIATLHDLSGFESLLSDWLNTVNTSPVIKIDASHNDPTFSQDLPRLLDQINRFAEGK